MFILSHFPIIIFFLLSCRNIYHCVHFILGDGVDRKEKHYLEFQDSLGDIKNGDIGFLRFAVEPITVVECVLFKVLGQLFLFTA